MSRRKALVHGVALLVAGLAPLTLAVAGILLFLERGYVASRSGEPYDTILGLVYYALMILVGLGVVAYALPLVLRNARRGGPDSGT